MCKKILVTGGTGYIGSHTCVELIKAGYEVIIVDNLYNSSLNVVDKIKEITSVEPKFYRIDLLDKKSLEGLFQEYRFDAVVHFAGLKAVGESTREPLRYYQNNLAGSLNLYELMQKYLVHNLVFSSSATVYGDPDNVPIKEDFPLGPTTNPYGTSKLFNEQILTDLAKANPNMSVVLLRYFNPIGAHPSGLIGEEPNGIPNNLLPYIAQVADGTREYLSVFGDDYPTPDGTGVRDYIHVVDLAKGHIKALEYAFKRKGIDAINLGTGHGYSVLEVLHAFEKACEKKIPYKIVERRPGDISECYADTEKAERVLCWKTEFGIDKMCEDAWNFQTNRKRP